MGTTHRGDGLTIRWTNNTGVAVAIDAVVVVGRLIGVALNAIAIGATGTLQISEEHELAATTAEAWPIGADTFWNTATSKLTADETAGYPRVGPAMKAKVAGETTACVKLNAGGAGAAAGSAFDWQKSVLDSLDFTAAEPAAPAVGDRYLNTGTGASSLTAQAVTANRILEWNGTDWTITHPSVGMAVMTEDDLKIFIFTTTWVEIGTPANLKDLTDGGNADALHVHAAAGITGLTATIAELNKLAGTSANVTAANLGTLTGAGNADALHKHLLASGATDVTATAAEVSKLAGASANVTAANLGTLTGAGNADALHKHAAAGLEQWKAGNADVAADVLTIPVTAAHVSKTTGGDAEALTLANGVAGQALTITLTVDGGGDGTLVPATKTGFATVVLADAGDSVGLRYIDDTVGWVLTGTAGVAAPPVITV